MLVFFGQLLENFERVIGGTIVDEDKFVIKFGFFDSRKKRLCDKVLDAFFFVVNWYNY